MPRKLCKCAHATPHPGWKPQLQSHWSINCLTSVRQLSFSTGKPMTMKINASSGFVLTERAANPRRPPPQKKKKCEDAPSFQMAWERGPTLLCCVLSTSQLSSQDQDALGRRKIQNQNQATSSELIRKQTLHFNQRGQRARSKLLASRQLSW